jgi:hypothetical protein
MTLHYSFKNIDPIWYSGALPYPEMRAPKVKIYLAGNSAGYFPPVFEIADLLTYHRKSTNDSAITVLFTYVAGIVPQHPHAPENGVWSSFPGTQIFGQIRMPLPEEAVRLIKKADGEIYEFELRLLDFDLKEERQNSQTQR